MRFRLIVEQVYNAGALSLVIIMTCGLFVGMVLGLQGYDLLQRFGSEDSLGTGAALALLKELGPVVTALLFAGRAGTALASEIGLMRATDQLAAMEMMAVDPMRRVVLPRFLGGVDLDAAADGDLHRGRHSSARSWSACSSSASTRAQFWSQMRGAVELGDVTEGSDQGLSCSASRAA